LYCNWAKRDKWYRNFKKKEPFQVCQKIQMSIILFIIRYIIWRFYLQRLSLVQLWYQANILNKNYICSLSIFSKHKFTITMIEYTRSINFAITINFANDEDGLRVWIPNGSSSDISEFNFESKLLVPLRRKMRKFSFLSSWYELHIINLSRTVNSARAPVYKQAMHKILVLLFLWSNTNFLMY